MSETINLNVNKNSNNLQISNTLCIPSISREVLEGDNSGVENSPTLDDGSSDNDSNFTSASTEPEPSDDEESTAIITFTTISEGGEEAQKKNPDENDKCESRRDREEVIDVEETSSMKTYEQVLEENEKLRRTLDSKNVHLLQLEKSYEVIKDENNLITLELQDLQRKGDDQIVKLERELLKSLEENKCLESRVQKMKTGIKELNEMMFEAILQLNSNGKDKAVTIPTLSLSSSVDFNSLALVPIALPAFSPNNSEINHAFTAEIEKHCTGNRGIIDNGTTADRAENVTPVKSNNDRTEKMTPIKKQIHRCLESVPASPHLELNNFKMSSFKSAGGAKNNVEILQQQQQQWKPPKKKKLLHAIDDKRQNEGFYCTCGACLTTKLGLVTHIKYHTYEGQFRCAVLDCRRRYFTTTSLKIHMKTQHGLAYHGREGCRKCGHTFPTRRQLYLHCKAVHNCGPLLYAGTKRQKVPNQLIPVLDDIRTPPPRLPKRSSKPCSNKCKDGTRKDEITARSISATEKRLQLFRMRHALDTSKSHFNQVYCTCGRNFTSRGYLRLHINYFMYEPKFSCKVCGKLYNDMRHLKQHGHLKHGVAFAGEFGCRACGIIFKTKMAFNQHCKKEHNEEYGTKQHKGSSKLSPLLANTKSTPPRNPKCKSKPSSTKCICETKKDELVAVPTTPAAKMRREEYSNRNIHMFRIRHELDHSKPHSNRVHCVCGRSFSSRLYLRLHVNYFMYEPKFPCNVCGKLYNGMGHLKQHMHLKHGLAFAGGSGCRACGIIFKTRMAFNQHCKKEHNNEGFQNFHQKVIGSTSTVSTKIQTSVL